MKKDNEPYRKIKIRPISGGLGAEVSGVDLSEPPTQEVRSEIRRAWLENLVIFFRDQDLDPAQFMVFAQSIGNPVEYPFIKSIDGWPFIIEVKKLEHEKVNFAGIWHSDTTYLDEPPMASMLLAREIPPYGGDTLFSNQYLAYETLSEGLRSTLEGMYAVSSSARADVSKTREDRVKTDGLAVVSKTYEARHPVIRTHPETGRKALYINIAHTARFDGWTEEESAPLLNYLFQHQIRPEFTCRFVWQQASLALWDNRCVQHNPVNDYHGFKRLMHRITLAGDRPT